MEWEDDDRLEVHCHVKASRAFDNQGMDAINVFAHLQETFAKIKKVADVEASIYAVSSSTLNQ